jgi:hypothetical protein
MASAGFDQAAPFTVDRREIAARGYPVRRGAYTRDDGCGVAALREHSFADPTCIPIVVRLGRTL